MDCQLVVKVVRERGREESRVGAPFIFPLRQDLKVGAGKALEEVI